MPPEEIPAFLARFREWLDSRPCDELLHTTFRFRGRQRGIRVVSGMPEGLSTRLSWLLAAVVKNQHKAGERLTWQRVAVLAGLKPKPALRNDLSELVYRGLLITTPVGYRTPDWRARHI